MIEIIPAIDIMSGRCVRLSQGDYGRSKVYDAQPLDMALAFQDAGISRLHLVDLDGAKQSAPANLKVLEQLASRTSLKIEWGGGIKSADALRSVFDSGATYGICGSVAALKPELFREWLIAFGPKVILGADIRDGKVAVNGWLDDTRLGIEELIDLFAGDGLDNVICTDISKDGMLQGPSFDLYKDLQQRYDAIDITVSGGISGLADIEKLEESGLRKVIVGKAIYEGRITIKDLERWSLRG
ncbi:MAG: 1-(5-phosphoribosyl)-5-[(5-phosphoribosylamino)methylideneamino]imidazole-4-carboxamide isomerase [Bacteroidales bacterium]|nr:1-(5-phosphoribosyl)-5-[(5-phosphoribosylamino)methylideneamino]imidazole-4-carboxamide isomerase [Bacteroidales bacterium]MBO7488629.1 1-(5-phosphoribosyl)-5-[(5-phosphoribosylamino)methylideneamino]imidazole-4-carboxamide isomerase [Bacteroidales bacterium]